MNGRSASGAANTVRCVNALARLVAEPGRAALLFDVDGTLAPIVEDPPAASVPEATRRELRRLALRYALVACVSGRPAALAREIVGVPELEYVGEHGLELEPEAEAWAPRIHAFADEVAWPAERNGAAAAPRDRWADSVLVRRLQLRPPKAR